MTIPDDRVRAITRWAQTLLALRNPGAAIGTIELGKEILARAGGDPHEVYKVLNWGATHDLAEYARRGEPRVRTRRWNTGYTTQTERPWLWACYGTPNDEVRNRCPHCGKPIKAPRHPA